MRTETHSMPEAGLEASSTAHPTASGEDDAAHRRCLDLPRVPGGCTPTGPALQWRFNFLSPNGTSSLQLEELEQP